MMKMVMLLLLKITIINQTKTPEEFFGGFL